MGRKILSMLLVIVCICTITSCWLGQKYTVDDLYGFWESTGDKQYIAYIHGDFIDVFAYDDAENIDWSSSWSGSFSAPESVNSYTWYSEYDYDRSQSNATWTSEHHLISPIKMEFKNNKLYWNHMVGDPTVFKKSEKDFPECAKEIERYDRCFEASLNAQPLILGEVYSFPNSDADSYFRTLACVEITNPNDFCVNWLELDFFVDDNTDSNRFCCEHIAPNSSIICVCDLHLDSNDSEICCTANYNKYSISFEGDNPTITVEDSFVTAEELTGRVSAVTVDTQADWIPDPEVLFGESVYYRYNLYIVFFKDDEIIGIGNGRFDLGTVDASDVITNMSLITDYDYYKIFVG